VVPGQHAMGEPLPWPSLTTTWITDELAPDQGREADATVPLLRPDEFHGYKAEPYPTGSRLLYVLPGPGMRARTS
jgi:hypothetical protein